MADGESEELLAERTRTGDRRGGMRRVGCAVALDADGDRGMVEAEIVEGHAAREERNDAQIGADVVGVEIGGRGGRLGAVDGEVEKFSAQTPDAEAKLAEIDAASGGGFNAADDGAAHPVLRQAGLDEQEQKGGDAQGAEGEHLEGVADAGVGAHGRLSGTISISSWVRA